MTHLPVYQHTCLSARTLLTHHLHDWNLAQGMADIFLELAAQKWQRKCPPPNMRTCTNDSLCCYCRCTVSVDTGQTSVEHQYQIQFISIRLIHSGHLILSSLHFRVWSATPKGNIRLHRSPAHELCLSAELDLSQLPAASIESEPKRK